MLLRGAGENTGVFLCFVLCSCFFLLDFFLGVEPFTAREDWGKALLPVELILRLVTPDRSRVLAGHCWQEELHI